MKSLAVTLPLLLGHILTIYTFSRIVDAFSLCHIHEAREGCPLMYKPVIIPH